MEKLTLPHFLRIALGSANETEYQLLLARDLKYINDQDYGDLNNKISEIRKMLIRVH